MNRRIVALILLIISVVAIIYYFVQKTPSDIESKGPTDLIKEILSLATAIVTLVASIVTYMSTRPKVPKE